MTHKIKIPPKAELERKYLVEIKSTYEIGAEYKCSHSTVGDWLDHYRIPIRASGCRIIPPKAELELKYLVEIKSPLEIGAEYKCSDWLVRSWLHKYNIPLRLRGHVSGGHGKKIPPPTKESLNKLYVIDGMSSPAIGKIYGVSYQLVLKWLRDYNIPVRCAGGGTSVKGQTCKILKKHSQDLKDDPERLSTEFLKKLIGVECE